MDTPELEHLTSLSPLEPLWKHFFTLSPLVVIGTRQGEEYNLAPKHLALPLGWGSYFGFVCTPRHRTYQNVKEHGDFTVSYPRPEQVAEVGRLAQPRTEEGEKPVLETVETFPARDVDGVFLKGAALFIECRLERFVERLGENVLVIGSVEALHVPASATRSEIDDEGAYLREHPLLAYVDPGRYAAVTETHPFPFPDEFDWSKAYPTQAGFPDFGK